MQPVKIRAAVLVGAGHLGVNDSRYLDAPRLLDEGIAVVQSAPFIV